MAANRNLLNSRSKIILSTRGLKVSWCAGFASEKKRIRTHWYARVSALAAWVRSISRASKSGSTVRGTYTMGRKWRATSGRRLSVNCVRSHSRGKCVRLCSKLWSLICRTSKVDTISTEDKTTWSWRVSTRCLLRWCTCLIWGMTISEWAGPWTPTWRSLIYLCRGLTHFSRLSTKSWWWRIMDLSLELWSRFRDLCRYWLQRRTAVLSQRWFKWGALFCTWIWWRVRSCRLSVKLTRGTEMST